MTNKRNRIKLLSVIVFILSIGPISWIVYGNDEKDINYSIHEELSDDSSMATLTIELIPSDKVIEISSILLPDGSIIKNPTKIIYQITENDDYEFKLLYKLWQENEFNEVIEKDMEKSITYQELNIKPIEEIVEEPPLSDKSNETFVMEEIAINEETFPDKNFRDWLTNPNNIKGYGENQLLSSDEIADIQSIDVSNKNIQSLKGIEYFVSLTKLECYSNQLTQLDLSQNVLLDYLYCQKNQLTELNLTNNLALGNINFSENQILKVDLTKNEKLRYIFCSDNKLEELNISKNSLLTMLNCSSNKLNQIHVTQNTALTSLYCSNNQLTKVDLSKQKNLNTFVADNQKKVIPMSNSDNSWSSDTSIKYEIDTIEDNTIMYDKSSGQFSTLTTETESTLFTSGCIDGNGSSRIIRGTLNFVYEIAKINELNFPDENFRNWLINPINMNGYGEDKVLTSTEIANITTMDVSDNNINSLKGIEYFTYLTRLECYNNQLTELDVSKNMALDYLYCYKNQLTELDLTNNVNLTNINFSNNQISKIDLTKNTKLKHLFCYTNKLTELNINQNKELINLNCSVNLIDTLDVTLNTAITGLYCSKNQLTNLNVTQNTRLVDLQCDNNQLTSLNVSQNSELQILYCSSNQLTELNVSTNSNLNSLQCDINKLTSLDVSNNPALTLLWCSSNPLRTLNVRENPVLKDLRCNNIGLTELDVSQNPLLTDLYCHTNEIAVLNVSNNTALRDLRCHTNKLTALDIQTNTVLKSLSCQVNEISVLDVTNNPSLEILNCHVNKITELDLQNNIALTSLQCYKNQLQDLDVRNNPALTSVICYNNRLTTIDLSNNDKITTFTGDRQKREVLMTYNNTLWSSHPNTNYVLGTIDNTNITYNEGQFSTNNTITKSSNFTTECVDGNTTPRIVSGTISFIYEGFVPVANIKDIPKNLQVNQTLVLSGTIEPSNATEKNIVWSIKDAGTTNAAITDNNLTVEANGTLVLTATIPGGLETGDYVQDFTIVTYATPSVLVSIPTSIELEREYHDESFEAVKEEEVCILSTTDTSVFDNNFYVKTEPSFHLLNTVDNDEWFTVQIYDDKNNQHTSKETPLAVLNSTRLSQKFYVKALKDIRNSKGSYQGTMNFVIGYGENQ